eukprot:1154948-Pelagomonas_calceolata.AAC.2
MAAIASCTPCGAHSTSIFIQTGCKQLPKYFRDFQSALIDKLVSGHFERTPCCTVAYTLDFARCVIGAVQGKRVKRKRIRVGLIRI